MEILMAIIASVVYALSMYIKKALSPENPQGFSPSKFIATLIWGIIVGGVLTVMGIPVSEENVQTQFVAYMGLIALTENILKIIWRSIRR